MSATKLALLGGSLAAAVLAAFWWQRDGGVVRVQPVAGSHDVTRTAVTLVESSRPAAVSPAPAVVPAPSRAEPAGTRPSEVELRARAAEVSYARIGGVLVDHLVARGVARADGELIVRRFFEDNVVCLFDALRLEADAQSVAYSSVLDALEAGLYDTDGPLLAGLIDMGAVANRVTPCAFTAAQQAGIESGALPETTRAAIMRRAR
jgi:hypothetical protein